MEKKLVKELLEIVYKDGTIKRFTLEEAPQFDAKIMLEQKIVRYFE